MLLDQPVVHLTILDGKRLMNHRGPGNADERLSKHWSMPYLHHTIPTQAMTTLSQTSTHLLASMEDAQLFRFRKEPQCGHTTSVTLLHWAPNLLGVGDLPRYSPDAPPETTMPRPDGYHLPYEAGIAPTTLKRYGTYLEFIIHILEPDDTYVTLDTVA